MENIFSAFLHKIKFTYGNDGGALVDGGAQHQTTDAAKSVNTNFRHIFFFFFLCLDYTFTFG